jgi:hypothetical protein
MLRNCALPDQYQRRRLGLECCCFFFFWRILVGTASESLAYCLCRVKQHSHSAAGHFSSTYEQTACAFRSTSNATMHYWSIEQVSSMTPRLTVARFYAPYRVQFHRCFLCLLTLRLPFCKHCPSGMLTIITANAGFTKLANSAGIWVTCGNLVKCHVTAANVTYMLP